MSEHFSIISDAADERIHSFRTLRESAIRFAQGEQVVVEGRQAVARLLASPLKIHSLFLERKYLAELGPALARRDLTGTHCMLADRPLMNQIVGFRLHQGIMAVAERPAGVSIAGLALPAVALNGLVDPENVGSIIRTAAAFGIRSFLIDAATADPYLRRSIRVSMGAALYSRVCRSSDLALSLLELKQRAAALCIEMGTSAAPLHTAALNADAVLVFGNERLGIAPEILACADQVLAIEINTGAVDSLNVHAAAAIALSALARSVGIDCRAW